jgi:hypothetical protein
MQPYISGLSRLILDDSASPGKAKKLLQLRLIQKVNKNLRKNSTMREKISFLKITG